MLGSTIIVFREVLEAALIISIVAAASRGVARRGLWISGGVAAGLLGAVVVAAFAGTIAEWAEGSGQELFNASVLMAAVVMLGWHNIWMSRHGRALAREMARVGSAVNAGDRPPLALMVVVALAVLREGAEVVLFMYGLLAGGSTQLSLAGGGLLGLALGAGLGLILYRGLLSIPLAYFFRVTGWLLLLLAAGLASQAAHFLVQADLVPVLRDQLWDTSAVLSVHSWLGQLLHVLVGYDPRPSGIQAVFYLVTMIIIGVGMKLFQSPAPSAVVRSLAVCAFAVVLAAATAPRAWAGPASAVYLPTVDYGETEIELRGGYLRDPGGADNAAQAYILGFGRGFTPWWFTELATEVVNAPGSSAEFEALEWENIFLLTETGRYWLDLGMYASAEFALQDGDANKVEAGPMLQKQFGRAVANLNLLAEREFGPNAGHDTDYAYRAQWRTAVQPGLDLGVQGFGDIKSHTAQLWGPAVFGLLRLSSSEKLKYDAAVLAGLNDQSPDLVLRWQLEYEFR